LQVNRRSLVLPMFKTVKVRFNQSLFHFWFNDHPSKSGYYAIGP
jgi:hypothetical protein